MTPDERRQRAALAYIHAADNARLLEQVARARNEPLHRWLRRADILAAHNAAAELDRLGIASSRHPRPGKLRRSPWH